MLVFPNIVKAGFLFGGQIGEGVLLKGGNPVAYYDSVAASYGLQAGVQVFGYVLLFMNDGALEYLDSSAGFELGVGPSIVVVDAEMGKSITSTTITQDIYALVAVNLGLSPAEADKFWPLYDRYQKEIRHHWRPRGRNRR